MDVDFAALAASVPLIILLANRFTEPCIGVLDAVYVVIENCFNVVNTPVSEELVRSQGKMMRGYIAKRPDDEEEAAMF